MERHSMLLGTQVRTAQRQAGGGGESRPPPPGSEEHPEPTVTSPTRRDRFPGHSDTHAGSLSERRGWHERMGNSVTGGRHSSGCRILTPGSLFLHPQKQNQLPHDPLASA